MADESSDADPSDADPSDADPSDADPGDDWLRTWHSLQSVLGAKWAVPVLRVLAARPRGFNALQRALDGITAKTLSRRLTELSCRGFVERRVLAASPPRTEYRLTGRGRTAATALAAVEDLARLVDCCDRACAVVWPDGDPPGTDCACDC